MLEEEDQAVAEEEPDALQVDGRAAHQLAGLVAVVEAEREPHELRVDRGSHVELDVERLLAGDQPAARHHRRAQRRPGSRIAPTSQGTRPRSFEVSAFATDPVRYIPISVVACEPIASTIETTIDHLYGRRNPSSRTKVVR